MCQEDTRRTYADQSSNMSNVWQPRCGRHISDVAGNRDIRWLYSAFPVRQAYNEHVTLRAKRVTFDLCSRCDQRVSSSYTVRCPSVIIPSATMLLPSRLRHTLDHVDHDAQASFFHSRQLGSNDLLTRLLTVMMNIVFSAKISSNDLPAALPCPRKLPWFPWPGQHRALLIYEVSATPGLMSANPIEPACAKILPPTGAARLPTSTSKRTRSARLPSHPRSPSPRR